MGMNKVDLGRLHLYLQETITVESGECKVARLIRSHSSIILAMDYAVPVKGHITVWLKQAKQLLARGEPKLNWQIHVSTLLGLAKVRNCIQMPDVRVYMR